MLNCYEKQSFETTSTSNHFDHRRRKWKATPAKFDSTEETVLFSQSNFSHHLRWWELIRTRSSFKTPNSGTHGGTGVPPVLWIKHFLSHRRDAGATKRRCHETPVPILWGFETAANEHPWWPQFSFGLEETVFPEIWPLRMVEIALGVRNRGIYCTRLTLIVTRSVSEGRNFCPRLRFGLRWNVLFLTACSYYTEALFDESFAASGSTVVLW